MYQPSMNSKMAIRASAWVRQTHRSISSHSMPAATHLTASVLSSTHPSVTFGDTSILTLPYGAQPEGSGRPIAIGALDLIREEQTLPLFGTGRSRVRGRAESDGALFDPFLGGIHDADGVLIAGTTIDDGGEGLNIRVRFTAEETGTYYVEAWGAGNPGDIGTYTLNAVFMVYLLARKPVRNCPPERLSASGIPHASSPPALRGGHAGAIPRPRRDPAR